MEQEVWDIWTRAAEQVLKKELVGKNSHYNVLGDNCAKSVQKSLDAAGKVGTRLVNNDNIFYKNSLKVPNVIYHEIKVKNKGGKCLLHSLIIRMLILALSLSLYSCEVTKVRQMLVSETVLESKENGFFIDEYLYDYVPISETDALSVESVFSEYVHYYNANDNYTITESTQLIVKMRKCNPNVLCVNATKKYGDRFLVCTSDSIGFK